MDRLGWMEAFVQTVDEGSMTKAAARLEVSLPVVVRALAALERRVGVRLLNRTTRRLHLTEPGAQYYEHCKRMLAELREGERSVSAQRSRPIGTVRVSAPVMFGRLHVAPAVAEFLECHPEVSVDLTLTDRIIDLVEDGMDVAVRIGVLPDSGLGAVPLGATQRVICASPGYLKRAGEPATPGEVKAHNFIRFSALVGVRDVVLHQDGRGIHVPIRSSFTSNHGDAVIDAALRGLGLACVLYYQVMAPVRAGALRLVMREYCPPPVPIHAVYLHPRMTSAKVRTFVEHLRSTFSKVSFVPDAATPRRRRSPRRV